MSRNHRPSGRFIRAVLFLGFSLALPALLFARAGGGESYSGSHSSGGGHSGGGGGGGDGLGWLIYELFRLIFVYPKVGVPLLLIVIAFFIYAYINGKNTYQASVIRRGSAAGDQQDKEALLASLRQNDPAFNEAAFAQRVHVAFLKIQEAWCGQNLAAVRPFISDGVYERFSLQFEEQRAQGIRNQMDNLRIANINIVHGYADDPFDVLSIRIDASAADSMVRIKDGTRISGSSSTEPFAEIWTFLRRRGAQTNADPNKPGLIEGNCPNCGGAIAVNQNANCQYCGAILRSGQYDWVLSEITQECEWQPGHPSNVPGLSDLRARDAGFNVQALEDRASVVFWRLATADRLASPKPLSKAALPEFIEQYQQALPRQGAERFFYGNRAVGSVDTLGILLNTQDSALSTQDSLDRALVEVRWSGTRFTAEPNGQINRHEQSSVSHLLLVLARKSSATSDADKGISSAHCPTCGAPESTSASGACDFCGATLNDGSQTWALADAAPLSSPQAQTYLAQLQQAPIPLSDGETAPPSPAAMLAWMVKMTLADGQLDPRERALLNDYAARYRVPLDRVNDLITAAQAGTLDVPSPQNAQEAQATMLALAKAALADGKIDRSEYELLQAAGQRMGLSRYDISQLLKRAKAELYAAGRMNLRNARKSG